MEHYDDGDSDDDDEQSVVVRGKWVNIMKCRSRQNVVSNYLAISGECYG